jgi:hypothetical protein
MTTFRTSDVNLGTIFEVKKMLQHFRGGDIYPPFFVILSHLGALNLGVDVVPKKVQFKGLTITKEMKDFKSYKH